MIYPTRWNAAESEGDWAIGFDTVEELRYICANLGLCGEISDDILNNVVPKTFGPVVGLEVFLSGVTYLLVLADERKEYVEEVKTAYLFTPLAEYGEDNWKTPISVELVLRKFGAYNQWLREEDK